MSVIFYFTHLIFTVQLSITHPNNDYYYYENLFLLIKRKNNEFFIKNIETGIQCIYQIFSTPKLYQLKRLEKAYFFYDFKYDEENKLIKIIDIFENQFLINYKKSLISSVYLDETCLINYEYDDQNNLVKITNQDGSFVQLNYRDYLLIQRIDENNDSFFWQYDNANRVIRTWGENHVMEGEIRYHPSKNFNTIIDCFGSKTIYYYDINGFVQEIRYGDGTKEHFYYDENDCLIKKIDRENKQILYKYNKLGQKDFEECSNGDIYEWEYDEKGKCLRYKDNNIETYYKYDKKENLVEVKKNDIVTEWYKYDSENYLLVQSYQEGHTYEYFYNQNKCLVKKQRLSDGASWLYDRWGHITQYMNPNKNESYEFFYTKAKQLYKINSFGAEVLLLEYDSKKRIVSAKIEGKHFYWTYNILDLVIKESDTIEELRYQYNGNGQLLKISNKNNLMLNITRNEHGQITEQKIHDSLLVYYLYDHFGRVKRIINDNDEQIDLQYDEKGNVFEKIYNNDLWEMYDFNEQGNIIKAENQFTRVEISYDENDNIVEELLTVKKETETKENFSNKINYLYEDSLLKQIILNNRSIQVNKDNSKNIGRKYWLFFGQVLYFHNDLERKKEIITLPQQFKTETIIENKKYVKKILIDNQLTISLNGDLLLENDQIYSTSAKVEHLYGQFELLDISIHNKKNNNFISFKSSAEFGDNSIVIYDGLGRIFLEKNDEIIKQYNWAGRQLLYLEETTISTGKKRIQQFIAVGDDLLTVTLLDDGQVSIAMQDNRFVDNMIYDVNSHSFKREASQKNTQDISIFLQGFHEPTNINRKFNIENWKARPNQQLLDEKNQSKLLITSVQVKNMINKYIDNLCI